MDGVILAAGKGTRMRPYSNAVNKEMSLIGPCPVIEYCVRALASCGVRRVYVVLSEGKHQIVEFLRSGADLGVDVAYIYQDMEKGKGTAKALATAEPWVRGDFMLVYGDSFFHPTDFFSEMVRFHEEEGADVTMGVYMMGDHKDYGVVKLRGDEVVDVLEKASEADAAQARVEGNYPVNSGPMLLNREVFDFIGKTEISPSGEHWLTDTIRLMVRGGRRVKGFPIPSDVFWRDIGRMEHRMEAEQYFLRVITVSNQIAK